MKRSWKRTRIWRRLVSGLLTAVMLVTMLPTAAYAALLDNTPDQNRQILEELTAFWGDEKTAQEAMELLRQYRPAGVVHCYSGSAEMAKEVLSLGMEKREIVVQYKVGDHVRITDGSMATFTGVVEEINPEKNKVTVEVTMFGREIPVELELDQVEVLEN